MTKLNWLNHIVKISHICIYEKGKEKDITEKIKKNYKKKVFVLKSLTKIKKV